MPPESRAWEPSPLQACDFSLMPYYDQQKEPGYLLGSPAAEGRQRVAG